MKLTCPECSKEVWALLEGGVCHSCFAPPAKAVAGRKKPKFEDRTCTYRPCGRVYSPKHPHQKMCSDECKRLQGNLQSAARAKRVYIKLTYPPLACASRVCSVMFSPKRGNQRFCCDGCKKVEVRERRLVRK